MIYQVPIEERCEEKNENEIRKERKKAIDGSHLNFR
jgi:hypothetical protein